METEFPVSARNGLYLYGVVPAGTLELSGLQGVEGAGDVSLVHFGDLACAVSPVPLSEYGYEGMTAHSEDLGWIAPRAVRHQEVVQQLRQAGPVIPMKFGALCSTSERVREILEKHHEPLVRLLEFLRGREEWGVRIHTDPGLAARLLEEGGPAGRAIDQGFAQASEGEAYFLRKRKQHLVSQQQERLVSDLGDELYQRLLRCAADGRKSRFTGLPSQARQLAVLRAAFLVDSQAVAQFQAALGQLEADYRDCGLTVELSGPWAPYSFCGELGETGAAGGAGTLCAG